MNCGNNDYIKRAIGVTRTFNWTVTTGGEAVSLEGRNLTLQLVEPRGNTVEMPFSTSGNVVSFTWQGEDQTRLGLYSLILWENYGEEAQRRVDIHNFVELMPWSETDSGTFADLTEETIELGTSDFGADVIVEDTLTSTSTSNALSANMGRVLNETKQDVIQDLDAIRSGAEAGATAYQKPAAGIPKTDLASGVQASLDKADNGEFQIGTLPTQSDLDKVEYIIPSQASRTVPVPSTLFVKTNVIGYTGHDVYRYSTGISVPAGCAVRVGPDRNFLWLTNAGGMYLLERFGNTFVNTTPNAQTIYVAVTPTAASIVLYYYDTPLVSVQERLAQKQDIIPDLATIRSGAEAGATAVQPGDLASINQALATIEAVIPSQASSTNKLTDKTYVDGAIATNTANFVGTFDTLAELQAVQNPTKNDYGFVIESDAQGNEYYDRYKYTGSQWLFEYKVESTPFTTEQWAAIQSGITAALVSKLSALPTNEQLNAALAGKQATIDDLPTIRSGAAAGATAYQKPASGIPASDMASAVQTSLGKADSAYQKPSSGIPKTDLATAVQTSLGKADAAAPQSTTYTKTEVDTLLQNVDIDVDSALSTTSENPVQNKVVTAALNTKQDSSQIATINGSDITHGGNVTIVAAEGQTITIDAAPTAGSNNAVSSGGVYNAVDAIQSELAPIAGRLNDFYYLYKLNKTSTKAILDTPIRLTQNGDYIQFKVVSVGSIDTIQNQQYGFSYGSNNSRIAIGLSANSVYVRAADGSTWIALSKQPTGGTAGKTIKISYEDSVIKVYADSELLTTYNGQPAFELGCFGWNNTYGYWDGEISDIVVNGAPYILSAKSSTSTVIETAVGSILSEEEQIGVMPPLMFEKTATNAIIYFKTSRGTYFGLPLKYRYKAYTEGQYPSYLDNWGLDQMKEYDNAGGAMVLKHTLFQSGEAEMAIRVPRGNDNENFDYVGGAAHGFDNIVVADGEREIIMLADGVRVDESEVVGLRTIDKFEVFQHSQLCQAYTNTNPWADVVKHWIFDFNGVEITTKVKILRALSITNAQFGMLCVYRHLDGDAQKDYVAGKAVRNDLQFTIFDITDGWWNISPIPQIGAKDHDCSKISVWGNAGYGFSLGIENASLKPNGGMFVGTNGGQAYNKVYFDLTGSYTPQVDEELQATQKWYFGTK